MEMNIKKQSEKVEFYNRKTNWFVFSVISIIFWDVFVIIMLYFDKEEINLENFFIYTLIGVLFLVDVYRKEIIRIILTDDKITFIYNYKIIEDYIYNYYVKEKLTRKGFYRLVIKNKIKKTTSIIDSNEWKDYEKIKEVFLERKLFEDKI